MSRLDLPTRLGLTAHPEGGSYRELHRSALRVEHPAGGTRCALTHILFHLGVGEVSRFHRVDSDEVWSLHRGALRLWRFPEGGEPEALELRVEAHMYCAVVPAGWWQAAEPIENEALVGCSVGPGFDFKGFELLDREGALAGHLRARGLGRFC